MNNVEDIDRTATAALEEFVYNDGQGCCAVERIYVHEAIYDEFVESHVEEAKKLVIGGPVAPTTDIGPLSRKEQKDFLLSQIKDAVNKGAIVLYGGNMLNGKGYFIEPTGLVNVNHEIKLMTEESLAKL